MTRYLAITTCNEAQWEQYGRAMMTTFLRHWPPEVEVRFYAEGFDPVSLPVTVLDLDLEAPWLPTWKALYRDERYNGGPGGRDYRHDAVRFAHKIAALDAACEVECDVLIWLDADIVTHEQVTLAWLDSLFPAPAVLAWLDRERAYPECGFLMFRMPAARKMIRDVVKAYRNGAIFKLPEWHDSYVIQHVVQRLGVQVHSLSGPNGRRCTGHPFPNSELGSRLDHLKGETRKAHGRSLRHDIKVPRPEAYWQ